MVHWRGPRRRVVHCRYSLSMFSVDMIGLVRSVSIAGEAGLNARHHKGSFSQQEDLSGHEYRGLRFRCAGPAGGPGLRRQRTCAVSRLNEGPWIQ